MFYLLLGFIVPVWVAWRDGSSYAFALSLVGVGVLTYIVNGALIAWYVSRRAPETISRGSLELTAGTGVVPRWVSVIGLIGMGLIPAGALVLILLAVGIVHYGPK